MAIKFGAGLERLSTVLEDENTTVSVEIEATAETIENAEGTAEAEVELDEVVDSSDAAAEEGETVEALAETVAEEGYTPALAKFCDKMGITAALNARMGYASIVGSESLSHTGPNEDQAKLVLAACEGWMKDTKDKIVKFFKELWEKIKRMFDWVVQKFRSYEATIKKLQDKMKTLSLDTEKAKDRKVKVFSKEDFTKITARIATLETICKNTIDAAATGGKKDISDSEEQTKIFGELKTTEVALNDVNWYDGEAVKKVLKTAAGMRSVETQFKTLVGKANSVATSEERSGGAAKDKDGLETMRKNAATAAKIAKTAIGAANKLAASWISYANAWLACAK